MSKIILLTGEKLSGKTFCSREIAKLFASKHVVFYNKIDDFGTLFLSECTPETQCIIFDDIWDLFQLKQIISHVKAPIKINRKFDFSFHIDPIVVICFRGDLSEETITQIFSDKQTPQP